MRSTLRAIMIMVGAMGAFPVLGQETIPEVVKRTKGNVGSTVLREFSPADLVDIVQASDTIVRGLVLDARAYLSSDKQEIFSDYTMQVLDRFLARDGAAPGPTVVVMKPGGTVVIDGYPYKSYEPDFPPFQPGEEYVLFLKYDESAGHYVVPFGAQGAFRNLGGVVEQVSREGRWNAERGRVSFDAFLREVTEQLPNGR